MEEMDVPVRTPDSFVTERLVQNNDNDFNDYNNDNNNYNLNNDLDLEMALAIKESLKIFEMRKERESSCTRLLNTLKRLIPYDSDVKKAYEYLLDSLESYYEGKVSKKENADFIRDQLTKVRLHQEDVILLSNIL